MNFGLQTSSNMFILLVMFIFPGLDQKHPFWANFDPENQNLLLKMKFVPWTSLNMLISMVAFLVSLMDKKNTYFGQICSKTSGYPV